MNRLNILLGAVCLSASATNAMAQADYTQLPISPSEKCAQIEGRTLTLSQAITIAEEHVGGVAGEAHFNQVGHDNASGITVFVYTESETHLVIVDGIRKGILKDTSMPRFPGLPASGELITTPSGLMYLDLKVGDGPSPQSATTKVEVHYSGYLNDGTKFDSSYDRGQTITFPLNGVIRGWTEGVQSMNTGGIRKLIIPGNLAYREQGAANGLIPPNALLIFDVELVSIPGQPTPAVEPSQEDAGQGNDGSNDQD